jgi:hypothetical protein
LNRHAIDVTVRHERASATPSGVDPGVDHAAAERRATRTQDAARDTSTALEDGSLRGTELWFARMVMTPEGKRAAAADDEAAARLTAGPRLTASERLDIYRRGYHARLVECLADDYSVLQHALGDAVFHDLCVAYIERHPSESPNLNFFGRHMESFCRREGSSLLAEPLFAADLAALEWAIVEVIHAPSSDPLTLDGLRDVPPDAWPSARLVPNTAVRLLRFEFPVNAYFQAFRDGEGPELPSARPSATVVYRSGTIVWRMDLTPPMFDVLDALVGGQTLGPSLARAEAGLAGVDPAEVAQRVTHWFREWVSSGLFSRVELAPTSLA